MSGTRPGSIWRAAPRRGLLRVGIGLLTGLVVAAVLVVAYAVAVEPRWVAVRTVRLSDRPSLRLIHITDLHYKGDRAYIERVVRHINAIPADVLCFTGDLIEDTRYLTEALSLLSQVRRPMYGVRGNHDALDGGDLACLQARFEASGGRWLTDERVSLLDGRLEIFGSSGRLRLIAPTVSSGPGHHLLLVHDPAVIEHLSGVHFDVILAGHTHGPQLRIPGGGPLLDLPLVGGYKRGLYQTPAGPLYVNPGLGTFYAPIRFGCRPEITVIEL